MFYNLEPKEKAYLYFVFLYADFIFKKCNTSLLITSAFIYKKTPIEIITVI